MFGGGQCYHVRYTQREREREGNGQFQQHIKPAGKTLNDAYSYGMLSNYRCCCYRCCRRRVVVLLACFVRPLSFSCFAKHLDYETPACPVSRVTLLTPDTPEIGAEGSGMSFDLQS